MKCIDILFRERCNICNERFTTSDKLFSWDYTEYGGYVHSVCPRLRKRRVSSFLVAIQLRHHIIMDMLEKEGMNRDARILDVGCGACTLIKLMLKNGYKNITACDISKKYLTMKGKYNFVECDINSGFPYKNRYFDVVLVSEVLEHLENAWLPIREVHRVLRPGGIAILTFPNISNWYKKLYYLFTSKLIDVDGERHLIPVFFYIFKAMIKDKFEIEEIRFNRSVIPFLKVNIPIKNFLFGELVIIKIRKLGKSRTSSSDRG